MPNPTTYSPERSSARYQELHSLTPRELTDAVESLHGGQLLGVYDQELNGIVGYVEPSAMATMQSGSTVDDIAQELRYALQDARDSLSRVDARMRDVGAFDAELASDIDYDLAEADGYLRTLDDLINELP